MAAKGATLLGRILRLERHGEFTVLDLQFSELEAEGVRGTLSATVDAEVDLSQKMTLQRASLEVRRRMVSLDGFKFRGPRFRLRPGDRVPLRTHAIAAQPSPRTISQ